MKSFLLILCLTMCFNVFAQSSFNKHVITHNRITINTNSKVGEKLFKKWGVFPDHNFPIRKVIMHVTLGYPDSIPIAHWDYCDNITVRRQGGVNGAYQDYEIGRMLTPYGSSFTKGWHFEWEVDVTDFSKILRDSVEIEYRHSGYEPESVGWALTIDFEIISGPPIVTPLAITKLWQGSFKYGDPKDDIKNKLTPISFSTLQGAAIGRIRIQQTGHGMDIPKGCSEFCSRWRDVNFDGKNIDHRNLWKNCGKNPLYPQGGTWVYDRGYWCPGDLQEPDILDIPLNQGKHIIDMIMEPYVATQNIQANENISAYLFQYSAPLKANDVSLDDIVAPSDKQIYDRLNPICFNSTIKIRNLGRNNLKSVLITYGTDGFPKKTFKWTGNLTFNQGAVILLPGEINSNSGINKFTVTLSNPNGRKDGWDGDNTKQTVFVSPEKLPNKMVLLFKTNNKPLDNELYIVNANSDTLFSKKPNALKPNTLYTDTLNLATGKYHFMLTDKSGDGLEFWAEPESGNGYLRILDLNGRILHDFESDCGNGQFLAFETSPSFVADTLTPQYTFSVYPRRTKDKTVLDFYSTKSCKMQVRITADGVLVEQHDYVSVKSGQFTYDLSYLSKGRYALEVFIDGISRYKSRLNKD